MLRNLTAVIHQSRYEKVSRFRIAENHARPLIRRNQPHVIPHLLLGYRGRFPRLHRRFFWRRDALASRHEVRFTLLPASRRARAQVRPEPSSAAAPAGYVGHTKNRSVVAI